MAPIRNVLQTYLRHTHTELLQSFRKSAALGHNALMGSIREAIIRDFLEKAFPKKFVVGTGRIFDFANVSSPQSDVIVYDESMPVLSYTKGTSHYMAEGVLAHIEVKSNLTKSELKKSLTNVGKIKNLKLSIKEVMTMGSLRNSIPSFVVAFSGPTKETGDP